MNDSEQLTQLRIENAELKIRVHQLEMQLASNAQPRQIQRPKLDKLGPFGVIPGIDVQIAVHGPVQETQSVILYEILNMPPSIASKDIVSPYGSLSPLTKITLPMEARDIAHIPRTATLFCFAYPLAGFGQLSGVQLQDIDMSDPHQAFLGLGGYVYFNEDGSIAQVNGIGFGNSLFFSGPYKWRSSVTRYLQKYGRFQPVTVSAIKDTGAEEFCWISPSESIDGWCGEPYTWMHGAFAYKFADPTENIYFVISDKPDTTIRVEFHPFSLLSSEDTDAVGDRACSICMANPTNALVLPCRHLCMCIGCCRQIVEQKRPCPLCRRDIEQVMDIFT